jgi:hypothetical protein
LATHHRDHALLLGIIQSRFSAGPLLVIKGAVQTAPVVAMSDLADGLRSEGKRLRYSRCGASLRELPKRQGAYDNAHLLNARSQEMLDACKIFRFDFDGNRTARHA